MSPNINNSSFSLQDYITLQNYTDSKVAITANKSEAIAKLTEKLVLALNEHPTGILPPLNHDPLAPVIQQGKSPIHMTGVTNEQLKKLETQALVKIKEAMLWSTAQKGLSNVYNYLRGSSSSQLISKLGTETLNKLVKNLNEEADNVFAPQKIQKIKVLSDIIKGRLIQVNNPDLTKEIKQVEEKIFSKEYFVSNTKDSMYHLVFMLRAHPLQKMISAISNFFSFSGALSTYHKTLRMMPDSFKPALLEQVEPQIHDAEQKLAMLLKGQMPLHSFNEQLIQLERVIHAINHDLPNPPPIFSQLNTRFQNIKKAVQEEKNKIKSLEYRNQELNNDASFLSKYYYSSFKIPLASFEAVLKRLDELLTHIHSDSSLLRGEKEVWMEQAQQMIIRAENTGLSRQSSEYHGVNAQLSSIKTRLDAIKKSELEKAQTASLAMEAYVTNGTAPSTSIAYQELGYKDLTDLHAKLKLDQKDASKQPQIERWKEAAIAFVNIQGFHTSGKTTLEKMIASK